MIIDILLLIIGFIFIIKASDVLVDSASNLALKLKVPKILIALTIVSFGTCAPEVAISFQSISSSDSAIAFANVIGSCIVNVFLIVGLASFIHPIKIKHNTIKKELPILFIVTTVFSILMLDSLFNPLTPNSFSKSDAFVLILLFILFLLYLFQMLFKKANYEEEDIKIKYRPIVCLILLVVSIILIIFSSDLIINSAKDIAYGLGISEKIITMFVIVIGTSLPEMIMTVTSAKKGEFDIAIGNIIGTNIFNVCVVLTLPIIIYGDISLDGFGFVDILMVFLTSFILFIFARSQKTITKLEGAIMLLYFIIYYIYLII